MFRAVILMQLRVIIYVESKKSAVFVSVIYTYKQSLNELQQPNLTGIFGTNNIYSLATQPWVIKSNASYQWLITSLAKEVMFLVALVSLSVCLFVCLWTTLLKNLWTDWDEILWTGPE